MKARRRKKAAGEWVGAEFRSKIAWAAVATIGVVGFGAGVVCGALVPLEGIWVGILVWAACGVMLVGILVCWKYSRRVERSWGRGLEAERLVGDIIEEAVTQPGCAFAHDVMEDLGGNANVDHVVLTPAGVWVVETKAIYDSKKNYRRARRQVARNVERVKDNLKTSVAVRGALVFGDSLNEAMGEEYDCRGKSISIFSAETFGNVLRAEILELRDRTAYTGTQRVERKVWDLGSAR